ncbi:hypothetical protein [Kiloniella majae]|uniref:hypothetical protein n=1 Tax=Kiloniella majae TaxID=1938558 RepID=UPI000A2780CD|nr:hypothetical protein [Kiloniella majae]
MAYKIKILIRGLFVLLSLGFGNFEAKASNSVSPLLDWDERPDDEIYVFGLELDGYILSEGFIIFFDGKEAFLPLASLADALEFPIEVNPDEGTAQGWFLNDDRTFDLNLKTGTVNLKDRPLLIKEGQVERHPDDLYVSFSELEKWFPFVLELRFDDLQIGVRALEPFPLQERIAKEARRSQIKRRVKGDDLELIVPKNDWFELPFLDISIDASGRNTENSLEGQVRQTTTVVGIVGGLDSEATLVANSAEEFPNIRLHMGRRSLDGGLLGPLDAREFSLGDVTTPDLALIADNTVGRGFSVSSFDLNRLEQTNRVTLRGELAVGWEVEIYRNGELIDFQTDTEVGDGRYEFTNVATVSGLNEFRLVFYGPQGQRREKFERYFVTAELAEPQKGSFRIAANQANRDLISFQKKINSREDDGENRIIAQAEYGITEVLSINGGVASLSYEGKRRNYAKVGAQTTLFGALGNMDIAVDDVGGTAIGARAQTQLGSWSFTGEQNWFQKFHSEQSDNNSVDGHLRSKTVARVNGHIPDYGLGNQPLTASVTHEISEDKEWETQIFGRVSSVVRPFNLALSSTARIRSDQESDSDARMLVSTLMGDFRLRGEVGYKITPIAELDKVSLSADWRINEDLGARFGLSHSGGDQSLNVASAGLNHRFDNFALGVNLEADSDGNYNARMGLSFSLGHDPGTGRIAMKNQAFARRSAVSAQVFLDKDNDGIYGPDDSLIENAGFSGVALSRDIKTSVDGTAFIVGLEPYREVEIGLNDGTLVDPFWVSSGKSKKLILRPGTTTTLQFPVIETGEVDGLVILKDSTLTAEGELEITEKSSAGLRVTLVDGKGQKISETMSAYDGYFFFDRIPYGEYEVILDQSQLEELGYRNEVGSKKFSVDRNEPFISAQDLIIQTGDEI